ncbi:DUF6985 domain-containing protein [Sulfitobacter sp. SBS6]|nr:hypothetical protein [Sulfitobacter pontiacus]
MLRIAQMSALIYRNVLSKSSGGPFLEFTFNQFYWQTDIRLMAWAEFTQDETTKLTFAPEDRNDAPMDAEEIALATWVQDNHETQKSNLLNAIFEAYPDFQRQFLEDYDIETNEDDLPTITSADDLAKVMTLQEIFVHQISKGGVPYVGYQFSTRWDEEHGLGVLMHDKRVIKCGGAETAFLLWIAEDDHDS